MRVLLVDDHELFRSGIKLLLSTLNNQIDFIEADSCEELQEIDKLGHVDLVLLDFHLPGVEGFDALKSVKSIFESIPIVILSGEDDPQIIRRSIDLGAFGFISKSSSQQIFIAALKLIMAGGTYLPVSVLSRTGDFSSENHTQKIYSDDSNGNMAKLSNRQSEVLALAIKGKPNKIISRELKISESTVKTHLSTAFRTLGVRNRTEAVFMAAKWNLDKQQSHFHPI